MPFVDGALLVIQGLRYWHRACLRLPRGIRQQCRLRAFARGPELVEDLGCRPLIAQGPGILHGVFVRQNLDAVVEA